MILDSFFLFLFSVRLFVTTANDLRLRRISIPDLIHYIFPYFKLDLFYNDYELSMLVGTDVCVRMVFVWEETGVPGGNPLDLTWLLGLRWNLSRMFTHNWLTLRTLYLNVEIMYILNVLCCSVIAMSWTCTSRVYSFDSFCVMFYRWKRVCSTVGCQLCRFFYNRNYSKASEVFQGF